MDQIKEKAEFSFRMVKSVNNKYRGLEGLNKLELFGMNIQKK